MPAATDAQVATWAAQAGWPKEKINEVVATSYAESGHDAGTANGLMQISPADAARYGFAGANVNDPVTNLRIAKKIYDVNGGWGAFWGTWPGPNRPVPQNGQVARKMAELKAKDAAKGGGSWLDDALSGVATAADPFGIVRDPLGAAGSVVDAASTVADIGVTIVKMGLWMHDPRNWWRVVEFGLGFVALCVGLWQLGAIPEGVKTAAKKVPEFALAAA